MEPTYNQGEKPITDYFAKELLAKLPTADPFYAAYEAQAVSRTVGFDFDTFKDVVPRALDEVRETKEAYEEEGDEGREHFGDETADIMFSLVNLARHAGATELPKYEFFEEQLKTLHVDERSVVEIVDGIADQINGLLEIAKTNPDALQEATLAVFNDGVLSAIAMAKNEGFDPKALLLENVNKYLIRCEAIEQLASEEGKTWSDLASNNEIVAYWKRAKILLK
jgi:uncharacterized protein YabN with tetrapyrrole methylase and pyrophosphatase domain